MQSIFKRYELKYILTVKQYNELVEVMSEHMELDAYGRHQISNIYFDTEDYSIIRQSLEKPTYKEKLRLRIYGEPDLDSLAFVELKKKYKGVVYKRRLAYSQKDALVHLYEHHDEASQIQKEIDYFIHNYEDLMPRVYLAYEREAYFCPTNDNLRMTFDFNIKTRNTNVSLYRSDNDLDVLPASNVLLEVKVVEGIPFWLLEFMHKHKIYKTSFSKYGTAFNKFILPEFVEDLKRRA